MLDLGNLRLDFYESGQGDTVLITFPDGSLGLVDAHPSTTESRTDILEILAGRRLSFVCLTHPHVDHALDLVRVLESDVQIDEFWHTNSDVYVFMQHLAGVQNWPSDVRQFARDAGRAYANVFIDLYAAVTTRMLSGSLNIRPIRAGDQQFIAGVGVYVLSPELRFQQDLLRFWMQRNIAPSTPRPDPNVLSAVMALRWGEGVILLGADALVRNWHQAVPRYRDLGLPRAVVLKVPHHGASNAFKPSRDPRRPNYLDVCLTEGQRCKAILFAGDSEHPNRQVYERLLEKTEVHCLINGLGSGIEPGIDLGIEISGASPIPTLRPCQPTISVEVDQKGDVVTLSGMSCQHCQFAPAF